MHPALDLVGIFAFAISGALLAIRRDFDVVGIAILAVATALGGGILRDLTLGATPPPAFTQWEHLAIPLAAAALALVASRELERLTGALLLFDAAGLGLFCVAGTVKALEHGLAPVAAATLGVTTAAGGGVLRDVIARETPALVRPDSELYAVPALVGGLAVAVAWELDAYTAWFGVAAAVAIFAVRWLAMRRHWRGPRARRRGT
ncbi:MAG TPA: trimeric intracellular cation channel family protein [Solirubrobacteraceae bacterium]|nr:trimeric intracellular cation channel family protein [Solirubrobacteraceae bacterium]